MTRVAVLADIHGNGVALKQVLAALDREHPDVIFGLGDYLSVSPGSDAVVTWMKTREHAYFVRGDNDCWESYERFGRLARDDPAAHYQFVTQLPTRIVLELQGITFLLQHGYTSTPIQEQGFVREAVEETLSRRYAASVVSLAGVDIACFGDFHRPHLELSDDLVLVHAGSVGAPRDQEPWTAKYVLIDLEDEAVRVTQRSVPFSREAAVAEVRAGYREDPGQDVWLARWLGLSPTMAGEWSPPFEGLTGCWRKPS
jgi:putative phosphoesterase